MRALAISVRGLGVRRPPPRVQRRRAIMAAGAAARPSPSRAAVSLLLVMSLGLHGAACTTVGVSASDAARNALESIREVPGWRVDRVGAVREAGPAEIEEAADLAFVAGRPVWLVPLFGHFPVGCSDATSRCDLAGRTLRVFVDASTGEVLGRYVSDVQ